MVGVWNGDFDSDIAQDFAPDVEDYGCYLVGQARDMVEQCPGVDLGAFFEFPSSPSIAPTPVSRYFGTNIKTRQFQAVLQITFQFVPIFKNSSATSDTLFFILSILYFILFHSLFQMPPSTIVLNRGRSPKIRGRSSLPRTGRRPPGRSPPRRRTPAPTPSRLPS